MNLVESCYSDGHLIAHQLEALQAYADSHQGMVSEIQRAMMETNGNVSADDPYVFQRMFRVLHRNPPYCPSCVSSLVCANYLRELYWEKLNTIRAIGTMLDCTVKQTSLAFKSLRIPTSVTLVRYFPDFADSPELPYYLRRYADSFRSPVFSKGSTKGSPLWMVNSTSKTSLECMADFLEKEAGVTSSVNEYCAGGWILRICGFRNCLDLFSYLDSPWYDKLMEIHQKRPNRLHLRRGEAIEFLIWVMRGGNWVDLPTLTELLDWDPDRAYNTLYRAMQQNIVESTGGRKSRLYRLRGGARTFGNLQLALLRELSGEPRTIREMSEITGSPVSSVANALRTLHNKGAVKRTKIEDRLVAYYL